MTRKQYIKASIALGCVICPAWAVFHHPREGAAGAGMGKKADDYNGYPLCHYHHTGDGGIHTIGKRSFEAIHGTEKSLWNRNRARLGLKLLTEWIK